MSKTIALVRQHERQLRSMAKDYAAIAKHTRAPIEVDKCNGIVLLLSTAADDMEDLCLRETHA